MPKRKESEMKNKGYAKFWGANTGPGEGGGGGGGLGLRIWKGWGCSSEIKPLKETNLGGGPTIFWPLNAIILNFDYMNRVDKMNWKKYNFLIFLRAKRDLYG